MGAGLAQLDNKKLPPAKVSIETQNISWHIYFDVVGPSDYPMRVSSLITDQYQGANLSNASRPGAKLLLIAYDGKCKPPN